MLQSRNTPNFRYSSLLLYGAVESSLLDSAQAILEEMEIEDEPECGREIVGAEAVQHAAEHLIGCYRSEERRVGNECVLPCRPRCSPSPQKHQQLDSDKDTTS